MYKGLLYDNSKKSFYPSECPLKNLQRSTALALRLAHRGAVFIRSAQFERHLWEILETRRRIKGYKRSKKHATAALSST